MAGRSTLTETEARFARAQRVARLATVDAQGRPHLIPVCYAFDGALFYTPLDDKPKRVADWQLQRVRNISAQAAVALLIDRYEDDWSRIGYLLVRGRAALLAAEDTRVARGLTLLRERYRQYRTMALENHLMIVITPQRVTSWGPALLQE